MLARIVYSALVPAPRHIAPELPVLGSNSTSERLTTGTRVSAGGSPPKPHRLSAAARSRSRQTAPHETGPHPRPLRICSTQGSSRE